jgi:micrococcal nuclease
MYEYKVKEVAKVVDGDTVDVVVDLGFSLYKKERCRVAGIDSPESRTRNKKEKAYGLEAKAYLAGILENADNLTVKTEKDGKYGRMLGWLYCDNIEGSINNLMIEAGYAWSYDGGTKLTDDERFQLLENKRHSYSLSPTGLVSESRLSE